MIWICGEKTRVFLFWEGEPLKISWEENSEVKIFFPWEGEPLKISQEKNSAFLNVISISKAVSLGKKSFMFLLCPLKKGFQLEIVPLVLELSSGSARKGFSDSSVFLEGFS